MPDHVGPGAITGGGGGVTVTDVNNIVDAQAHVTYQQVFADLPTANAFITGAVPAGEFWKGHLADGTPIFARAGETTWTVDAGGGNVDHQGVFASIAAANAGLGGAVPAPRTYTAITTAGTLLYAESGATTYTAIDSGSVRRLGSYADQPTADAALATALATMGGAVPADIVLEARLADGTSLVALPGATAWSEEVGPGEIRDQGDFATVPLANAGIPGGGVPPGQTYLATSGGVTLIARAGETVYTLLGGGSGSVQNQGVHADLATAETVSGFPGTPVPAGEIYLAATPDADLVAYPGETGYRVNWRNQWPGVVEVGTGATTPARPGSRVYVDNGGTVVLPSQTEYNVSPWITLIQPVGVVWTPTTPPLLAVPGGDTPPSTVPWHAGEVHLERLPSGQWVARADAEPGEIAIADTVVRTADFTVVEGTSYDVDSSGGPINVTVPTGTEAFSIRQIAGTQTTVAAPLSQASTSITLNEQWDWIRFRLQPNGLYAIEPLDNWGSVTGGGGVTLGQVSNLVAAEQFPVTNLTTATTFNHTRPNAEPDVWFVFDGADPMFPGELVAARGATYPSATQVNIDPGPLGGRTVAQHGILGLTGTFYVN